MGIIGIILVGFVIGIVARFLKPGNDSMGFFMTSIVGILGALIGSYLGQFFGIYHIGEPAGFFGAVVGAIIVLGLLRIVTGRTA